ncbi:MAG: DUF4835 family protein [Ignavibacteriaceae bacterium]|nr:DUF4835 family protein [Ignavibacteriaceae bacterium]NUM69523.1 DUF4835 family protein [Ignavibacteriaceae bacterium]
MKKLIVFLFIISSVIARAQEIDATVTVNYEKLPIDRREILVNFASVVEDYLDKTKFTNANWDFPKIKCNFSIFFLSAVDEINYTAQVVVSSQREIYKSTKISPMFLVNDNSWSFTYEKNQAFYFDLNYFNSLSSFLDYYAFMIIGFEEESWKRDGGTEWFQKALDIVNLAAPTRFSSGWESGSGSYSRRDFVSNILSEKFRPFREAAYDYQYGVDYYEKNKEKGIEKIVGFVKALDAVKSKFDIKSVYVKAFFDAKSGEILDRLRDYEDKSIFKILKSIDPQRIAKYDEAMGGQ